MPLYDLLLKGGTIIDGQRTPRFSAGPGTTQVADGLVRRQGGPGWLSA